MCNDIAYTAKFHPIHRSHHGLDINLSGAVETDLLQSPNPGATVQVLQHQGAPESCNKKVSN